MYRAVKIFNITNAEDFVLGSKMAVKEIGPVTYEMEWHKSKFFWKDEGILSYRRDTVLKFVPELNWVDENEEFYTLNSTLIQNADNLNDFKENQLIIKTTIKQYMQDTVDKSLNLPVSRGDCPKEEFTIHYKREEGNENLNFIQGSYANATSANETNEISNAATRNSLDIGPPMDKKEVRFKYLEPDLCQCMVFIQADFVEVDGVKNIRFEVAPVVNGFNELDRSEFFQKSCRMLSNNGCCPTFPVVLSLPHFYSSPDISNSLVSGLHPNESIHNSFIVVEPTTGLTTSFVMRYQFNVKLAPSKNWGHVRAGTYPLYWVEDSGTPSEETNWYLFFFLKLPSFVLYCMVVWISIYVCIGVLVYNFAEYCYGGSSPTMEEIESLIESTESRDYRSINESELPEKESPPLLKAFPGYSRYVET
ncbi:Platelet glycoprotein 4 [Araneus ventricosus]|uniref:Platelet glycoprotein 4 n=1 Tax=Araneus ventricosus TaxID=182803 RepID=A0A4Y2RE39_ARAVE|nr:Platelet glycoprotein 4 [Araneus ventricosus]